MLAHGYIGRESRPRTLTLDPGRPLWSETKLVVPSAERSRAHIYAAKGSASHLLGENQRRTAMVLPAPTPKNAVSLPQTRILPNTPAVPRHCLFTVSCFCVSLNAAVLGSGVVYRILLLHAAGALNPSQTRLALFKRSGRWPWWACSLEFRETCPPFRRTCRRGIRSRTASARWHRACPEARPGPQCRPWSGP